MTQSDFKDFEACKAVVCDLDGTLYLDGEPLPHSHEFLERVISSGRQLYYFTNNSSKSRETYLKRLESIGFPSKDEYLITSTDCAIAYLKNHSLYPEIYLVGNKDLYSEFANHGFSLFDRQQALDTPPKAVVLGFDTELDYEKIDTCYQMIIKEIPYIATHSDYLCPVGKGSFKPDVGSFISMFETATQGETPIVVGKPHLEAVEAISEKAGVPPEKIAFIGDRLYTDIRMAQQYNMIGVLVFSGETSPAMLKDSNDQPRLAINDVGDLMGHLPQL